MLKVTLIALASLVCVNAQAAVGDMERTPFAVELDYIHSEHNPGKLDTVVVFEATDKSIKVNNIIVDNNKCTPYKVIPGNYVVPKGEAFSLRFYGNANNNCKGETIRLNTADGDFEING